MTREEFFDKLNNGAKWDVGVAINRTNPVPLDANEIFDSIASMESYIKTNPLAYPGQIVVVLGETETAAYLVNAVGGEGKGYSKLAATTGSGDVGEELTKLAARVAVVEGYFEGGVAKKATADAEGNVITSTYATKSELSEAEQDIADNSTAIGKLQGDLKTVSDTATAAMPKAGGDFTGEVTVLAPTADMNPATKKYVDDALGSMTGVDFKVVTELPETGEKGVIYLVAHSHGDNDSYDEYIWVTDKFEKIGNTDIDLSDYAKTADLKADAVAVGAGETVKSISETNGIISVEKQAISIEQSQVAGLADVLAGKQNHSEDLDKIVALEGEGLIKKTAEGYVVDSTQYLVSADLSDYAKSADVTKEIGDAVADKQTAEQVKTLIGEATIQGSKVEGNVAKATLADTASKVAEKLTVGSKEYDGSVAVEITAEDLGALTAIPQATIENFGGIKLQHVEGDNEHAVQLDSEGRAYVTVELPAAIAYDVASNGGLAMSEDHKFSIAESGIVTSMIGDGQVTDAKIDSVNVNKLFQSEGDELVLNGGNAGVVQQA